MLLIPEQTKFQMNNVCLLIKSNNEYRVCSQYKDNRDTWYNVIYKGSTLHFCNCNWALNGNVCKHVLKFEMLVSNIVLRDNTLSKSLILLPKGLEF